MAEVGGAQGGVEAGLKEKQQSNNFHSEVSEPLATFSVQRASPPPPPNLIRAPPKIKQPDTSGPVVGN